MPNHANLPDGTASLHDFAQFHHRHAGMDRLSEITGPLARRIGLLTTAFSRDQPPSAASRPMIASNIAWVSRPVLVL